MSGSSVALGLPAPPLLGGGVGISAFAFVQRAGFRGLAPVNLNFKKSRLLIFSVAADSSCKFGDCHLVPALQTDAPAALPVLKRLGLSEWL